MTGETQENTLSPHIYVDGDACPVKEETYKVAYRTGIPVSVVANSYFRIPRHPLIKQVVVETCADAADDYIAERADKGAVVITADILLAERCLKAGAAVISPTGKPFTADSIGAAVATRTLMVDLRAGGGQIGGAPLFSKGDRSRFLSALDVAVTRLKRTCS